MLPLKCSFLPDLPVPRSPVHRHLKFSAVLGTTSASRPITILHKRGWMYMFNPEASEVTGSTHHWLFLPSNRFAAYLDVKEDAWVLISLSHLCSSMQCSAASAESVLLG